MSIRMFVGGLHFNTDERALEAHFEEFGFTPEDAIIMRDHVTQHSRGFGFVEVTEQQGVTADAIRDKLHGKKLDGRALTVNIAVPKEKKSKVDDASSTAPRV